MQMSKRVIVTVTKQDINDGEMNCVYRNPVAKALSAVVGQKMSVSPTSCWTETGRRTEMPRQVEVFMNAYDNEKPTQSFTFTMDVNL